MNRAASELLIFVTGATLGSLVTYYVVHNIENERANREIKTIRNLYEKEQKPKQEKKDEPAKMTDHIFNSEDKTQYTNYAKQYSGKEEPVTDTNPSGVIGIDQFTYDDDESFNKVILTLYSDGVLADDLDNVINDVPERIGIDNITELSASNTLDEIYIRNLTLNTDYQIVKGSGTYEEVTGCALE